MLQDIFPKVYHPEFHYKDPAMDSYILFYKGHEVLMLHAPTEEGWHFPRLADIKKHYGNLTSHRFTYLFSVDEEQFFLLTLEEPEPDTAFPLYEDGEIAYRFEDITIFRLFSPRYLAFAGATGSHIYNWMEGNRFCGRCGSKTAVGKKERSMVCPSCGQIIYPRISPAVIVAVTDGDRILLTKHARGNYSHYALVAGFIEVGETAEDAIVREVYEEVGLRIKDIRPYKSQPWGLSDTLMLGFTARLDGSDRVRIQREELKEATWFPREQVPLLPYHVSIGQEMIESFKRGLL